MSDITLVVPDIGGNGAEVVEVLVSPGETIIEEQSLLVLESDKASMEVPATCAGTVKSISVSVGDELKEGDAILIVEAMASATEPGSDTAHHPTAPVGHADNAAVQPSESPVPAAETARVPLSVPDIGSDSAEVVEVLVSVGDVLEKEDSLIVLESDKASMEVPAASAGRVAAIMVKVGDSLREGDVILEISATSGGAPASAPASDASPPMPAAAGDKLAVNDTVTRDVGTGARPAVSSAEIQRPSLGGVYAGPAVRKLAREFGIDLTLVTGTGPRGRLVKEDLHQFVSSRLAGAEKASTGGSGIEPIPSVDFAQFGSVQQQPRSRLEKLTAANMSRAWLNVPHVTQFDDADITDLESFRKSLKTEAERRGTKLSPLPFILKAVAVALNDNPKLRSSLADGGEILVHKDYCHIGMAVDTPAGLVVPVIRDVDKKSVWEIGEDILVLAALARERKLRPEQMQGGVFSVSSLGNIGGRGFTPIVNAPEVAILGVSRAGVQPVWDGSAFVARTLLPLSLSYDHRVINGGDAGRFLTQLVGLLSDIRRCLM